MFKKSLIAGAVLFSGSLSFANFCPDGPGATIQDAYAAMKIGSYWVDEKKVQNADKFNIAGIVFVNLDKDPGAEGIKDDYKHGAGVFKIDYSTTADASRECRRQIRLIRKGVDGRFVGKVSVENCEPGNNAKKARSSLGMRLKFKRHESHPKFGPHCEMEIFINPAVAIVGGSPYYSWKLTDKKRKHRPLRYFDSKGQSKSYRP